MPLEGFLEKSAKYTKSWAKRYLTFDAQKCALSYGQSEAKMKATVTVTRIVRASELSQKVVTGSPDLYSFSIEGNTNEGKPETFAIRCPDGPSFDQWFFAIRNALGASGAMDAFNYGLPDRDPRTDLPLVHVPTEHLYRFHLLDRAILYYFDEVNVFSSTGGEGTTKELLIIGDRYLYLFQFTAEMHRCVPIASIKGVFACKGCVGLKIEEPQHDILIVDCLNVPGITDVLSSVLAAIPNQEPVEPNTSVATMEGIREKLHLVQREAYALKVMSPTPKMKLKAAMDTYEKQTGEKFVYGSSVKPAVKKDKAAVHRAPEAAAAMDMDDPMAALLMKLRLTQYVVMLQRQHVDLDLIACMEADDLVNFGIDVEAHRAMISAAAKGEPIPGSPSASPPPQATAAPGAAAAPRAPIVLDDSEDDLPPPKPAAARRVITLSSDDDDDLPILPPKRDIVLDDSDDDLPGPIGMNAPAAVASPTPASPARVVDVDDDDI